MVVDDSAGDTIRMWEEAGPLGRFVEPIDRVGRLNTLIDAARSKLGDEVARARAAGSSWAEIGAALGMTRQSAHERYGRR